MGDHTNVPHTQTYSDNPFVDGNAGAGGLFDDDGPANPFGTASADPARNTGGASGSTPSKAAPPPRAPPATKSAGYRPPPPKFVNDPGPPTSAPPPLRGGGGGSGMLARERALNDREALLRSREADVADHEAISKSSGVRQKIAQLKAMYRNIPTELPEHAQSWVRQAYRLYFLTLIAMFWNACVCTGIWLSGPPANADSTWVTQAVFAVIYFFTAAFGMWCLWLSPLYEAFKADSSRKFFCFFVGFAAQCVFSILVAFGGSYVNSCGFLSMITVLTSWKWHGTGIACVVDTVLWTVVAGWSVKLFRAIYYRHRNKAVEGGAVFRDEAAAAGAKAAFKAAASSGAADGAYGQIGQV